MNPDVFDVFARQFAAAGSQSGSRRALLRAIGLGGAAIATTHQHTAAQPSSGTEADLVRRQGTVPADIEELAFQLEYDVEKIFTYVRDEVTYDPYAGVLRGAKGTLWGLAGNSADQAILLAALLSSSMVQSRFVVGELSDDIAQLLIDAAIQDEDTALRQAAKVLIPPAPADAPPSLTADEEAFARQLPEFAERYRESVNHHVANGIATVTGALAGAGIVLPAPASALPDLERRQHVWLQYSEGTTWIDLDPSVPGSNPGDAHGTNSAVHDELAAELFHRVTLRMVAEQILGGVPSRQVLVSHTAPSADLVGLTLTVFHPQAEALKATGQAIAGEIGGYRNFMTTLLVGEETISGRPVTFSTESGIQDAFGPAGPIEGDTIAEWLEIEIEMPHGRRQATRELFDRIGFAERASGVIDLAKVRPLELVDAGDPELSYLPLAGLWSISVVTGPVPERYVSRPLSPKPQVADLADISYGYHYAYDVFSLRASLDTGGPRSFIDEPNVTAYVLRPTITAGDQQAAETGIDLLHRSAAVIGMGESSPPIHPLVASGVLRHAIEQATVQSGTEPLFELAIEPTSGVGHVFETAEREGIPILVLTPSDNLGDLDMVTDSARIRIQTALDVGLVVIVPERSVSLGGAERSGWWLVDPLTGATFDQMDDGGGADMATYAVHLKVMMCALAIVALGAAVIYGAKAASLLLTPAQGAGSADEDAAADASAAQAAAGASAAKKAAGSGAAGGGAALYCAAG